MKIFDLELKESLLTVLSEDDTSKICGGASATDAAIASAQQSAAEQLAFSNQASQVQAELSAAQAKASINQAVAKNTANLRNKIK